MEFEPKDIDIVKLLTNLKNAETQYPSDMLASRRHGYVQRVAEIGMGLGVAAGLKTTLKSAKAGGSLPSTIGGLLETALVVAIVAEASAAAYFYRNEISDFIQSYVSNPQPQEVVVVPPPEISSPIPQQTSTEIITPTETPSPTGTTTVIAASTSVAKTNSENIQANGTPDPNGNQGNHFGQTPKPERTRDPGDNGDNGNGNKKSK